MQRNEALTILSLADGATNDDLTRAYRAAAKRTHPDVGGSVDAFIRVRAAYACLLSQTDTRASISSTVWPPPNASWRMLHMHMTPRSTPGGAYFIEVSQTFVDTAHVMIRLIGWNTTIRVPHRVVLPIVIIASHELRRITVMRKLDHAS
jgi:hypothetical protein